MSNREAWGGHMGLNGQYVPVVTRDDQNEPRSSTGVAADSQQSELSVGAGAAVDADWGAPDKTVGALQVGSAYGGGDDFGDGGSASSSSSSSSSSSGGGGGGSGSSSSDSQPGHSKLKHYFT